MSRKAKQVLRKLDYLPRWAWYALSFFIGGGPFGLIFVYLAFHVLEKSAAEPDEDESAFDWNVDIDRDGVHVRGRSASAATYSDGDCIVTDDEEIARQWGRTEASARSAQSEREEQSAQTFTEDAGVADVIRQGQEALRLIRRADDIIADPELSAQIVSIEDSCKQILSILEQRPQVLPQLRTFLRYYLPTTLKLLDARSRLENNANTPRARQVSARVSQAIGEIDKAFKKQVEALDEYRFIDLESEMDVLRDMLRADGLADEPVEEDPFGDVLSARRKSGGQSGGTPMATH